MTNDLMLSQLTEATKLDVGIIFHKEVLHHSNHTLLGITDSAARWVDKLRVAGNSYAEIAAMLNSRQADEYFKQVLLYYTVLDARASGKAAGAARLGFTVRGLRPLTCAHAFPSAPHGRFVCIGENLLGRRHPVSLPAYSCFPARCP